jgi:acetyl esterase/lipase
MPHVVREVEYAARVGFRPLTLDLHLPDETDVPLVLFAHGGGWRLGTKATFCPTIPVAESFDRIVAAGYAVASVDYRLSGEAVFPAQVDDVRDALIWLRAHGDEYGYDASRILAWGESAGATLVALVALEPGAGILGVVDWYGPSNLITMAERGTPEEASSSREAEWLGASALEQPETAHRASPVFQVGVGAPPFHIEHGTDDAFVPYSQSEELAAALTDHGAAVELVAVARANHMWRDLPDGAPVDRVAIMTRALDFLSATLAGTGSHAS